MKVGPYEVGVEIGRGWNGTVHLARDSRDGREIALKIVNVPATATERRRQEMLARFRREADVGRSLAHPGIVAVHDMGIEHERLWLAMDLAGGRPLSHFVEDRHRLEVRRIVAIVRAVADALEHAHEHGIVHRDVTPENLILDSQDRVKLLDFGVARSADSDLTGTGEFLGTPQIVSPEQIRGEKPGPAADQYALAATTYRLLAGRWPFAGDDAPAVFEAALSGAVVPLSSDRPDLPSGVGRAIEKALACEPADRFTGVRAFSDALVSALRDESALPTRSPLRSVIGDLRSLRESAGWDRRIGALALLVGLLVTCWLLVGRTPREERIARLAERSVPEAREELARWRDAGGEDWQVTVAEGHVAFEEGALATGVTAYARAARADPRILDGARVLRNLETALESDMSARTALLELAPLVPRRFERVLRRNLGSEHYFRRWHSARMLEKRGEAIDLVPLYIADLGAGSCSTRQSAVRKLGQLRDRRAIEPLRRIREEGSDIAFCPIRRLAEEAISTIER